MERSWTVESQTDQDGDRIASENVCQKPAGNSRRLKKKNTWHFIHLTNYQV